MSRSRLLGFVATLSLAAACGGNDNGDAAVIGDSAGGSGGTFGVIGGAGGKAGHAGKAGSATAGHAGTGGTSSGGTSAGGTSTGGTSSGGTSAGGTSSGGASGKGGSGGAKAGAGGIGGSTGGSSGGKGGASAGAGGSNAGAGGANAGAGGSSAGAGGATAGAAGTTGGTAGTTGGTAGTTGGAGVGGGCSAPADCPPPTGVCVDATCDNGACGTAPKAAGTQIAAQTPGDCQVSVCDGMGAVTTQVDDNDLPVDGNPCTDDVCTNGVPTNPDFPADTACTGPNLGQVCDGMGTCVQCTSAAQCGGGACSSNVCTVVLLISELQTRGASGASDEFVELYNPMDVAVTFDATWKIDSRSTAQMTYGTRFTGTGQSIPPHGHLLVVGSSYSSTTTADGMLTSSITDAGSVRVSHNGTVVDAVCFAYDMATTMALTSDATYTCEGTPATSPHDNTNKTNTNASLERKPGGAMGNGQDMNDNAIDFQTDAASNPQDLASAPTPLRGRHGTARRTSPPPTRKRPDRVQFGT